jgi:hypothetical protein
LVGQFQNIEKLTLSSYIYPFKLFYSISQKTIQSYVCFNLVLKITNSFEVIQVGFYVGAAKDVERLMPFLSIVVPTMFKSKIPRK